MIYTERVISVKNGTATIDQPIVLFRGDRNIEIVFEIVNSKFKFSEKGNYILDIGAKYGQLAVDMPDGTDLFTEIAECLDGKVIFKITGDMINEIAENGFYSFHVRLFNDDKTSRVTIPPIMEGIEVREPIVIEGDAIFPIVDMGGADIAPIDSDEETFIDENGKLNIVWQNGDIISSTRLNQMVEFINVMEDKLISEENLASYATIEYVDIEFNDIDAELNVLDSLISDISQTAEKAETTAMEVRGEINSRYNELNEQLNEQQNKMDQFEVTVSTAEAYAEAAFEEVKNRATNVYVDQKDGELLAEIEQIQNGLLDYATIEYVDGEIDKLEERVDKLGEDIANAGVDMLREDLEAVRAIAESTRDQLNDDYNQFTNTIYDLENRVTTTEEYVNTVQDNINETIDGLQNDINDHTTRIVALEEDTAQLKIRVNSQASAMVDMENEFIAFDDRISALENSEDENIDLTDYATKEYVDAKDGELTLWIDDVDAQVNSLTFTVAGKANNAAVEQRFNAMDEFVQSLDDRTTSMEESISDIQTAIEILPDDPANPGQSECVTRQYVYDNFVNSGLFNIKIAGIQNDLSTLNDWTVEEVDKLKNGKADNSDIDNLEELHQDHDERIQALEQAEKTINNTIGDINSILDAINGEVI